MTSPDTFISEPGSNSDNGRPIKVTSTASPGTPFHTAASTGEDVIAVDVVNTDSVPHTVTILWGGTTSPDDTIKCTIPPAGTMPPTRVIPGWVLKGSKVAAAFADTANVLTVVAVIVHRTPGS
jgi:hypothetical protein